MNMDSCFRRNDGKRLDSTLGFLQQPVTPGEDPGSMLNG
jgi:hypothetical protein